MISRLTPSFRKSFAILPAADQAAARKTYMQFPADPGHPSLRFKKLAGHDAIWSVRITRSIRAVEHREGDTIIWVWIGTRALIVYSGLDAGVFVSRPACRAERALGIGGASPPAN